MHTLARLPSLRALITPWALALAGVVAAPTAYAQSAQLLGPYAPGEYPGPVSDASVPLYELRVANPRLAGSFDAVVFSKLDTPLPFGTNAMLKTSVLRWSTTTLAADIDLYAVQPGDVFAEQQVAAGSFAALGPGHDLAEPWSLNPALGSFYLGVRVAVSPEMSGFWQGSMGWLKFQTQRDSEGYRLVLLDSHIAYDASSVVVGQVPEGSTLTLALSGLGIVGGLAAARRPIRA
jgi:hypothetical protein